MHKFIVGHTGLLQINIVVNATVSLISADILQLK